MPPLPGPSHGMPPGSCHTLRGISAGCGNHQSPALLRTGRCSGFSHIQAAAPLSQAVFCGSPPNTVQKFKNIITVHTGSPFLLYFPEAKKRTAIARQLIAVLPDSDSSLGSTPAANYPPPTHSSEKSRTGCKYASTLYTPFLYHEAQTEPDSTQKALFFMPDYLIIILACIADFVCIVW